MNLHRIGTLAEQRADAARLSSQPKPSTMDRMVQAARFVALLGMAALAVVLGWGFIVGVFCLQP